jgi:hypothetical protein
MKRYFLKGRKMEESADGTWITYKDHCSHINFMEARLEIMRATIDQAEANKAEVIGLRKYITELAGAKAKVEKTLGRRKAADQKRVKELEALKVVIHELREA